MAGDAYLRSSNLRVDGGHNAWTLGDRAWLDPDCLAEVTKLNRLTFHIPKHTGTWKNRGIRDSIWHYLAANQAASKNMSILGKTSIFNLQ